MVGDSMGAKQGPFLCCDVYHTGAWQQLWLKWLFSASLSATGKDENNTCL